MEKPNVDLVLNTALDLHTFNLPAPETCRGQTLFCTGGKLQSQLVPDVSMEIPRLCYAQRGQFVFPSVKASHVERLTASRRRDFVARMTVQIHERRQRARNPRRWAAVRLHSSGDFYSVTYAWKWYEIAVSCPDQEFYVYTRTWRLPHFSEVLSALDSLTNFHVWWSTDWTLHPAEQPRILSHGLEGLVTPADPLEVKVAYVDGTPGAPPPNCLKQLEGKHCWECGRCWDPSVDSVTFLLH